MSISLIAIVAALPIALTARVVMGEQKFNEWVESDQLILPTNFSSMDEMRTIVTKAGYDVTTFMGSPKTHLSKATNSWFLWRINSGKISAVMSKRDNKTEISKFVKAVESVAGKQVFFEKSATAVSKEKQKTIAVSSKTSSPTAIKEPIKTISETIPTVFVDENILKDILKKFDLQISVDQKDRIECYYGSFHMSFIRSNEEAFDLTIKGNANDMKSFYTCLFAMNEEYGMTVQEQTYMHVLSSLEETDLSLIEETVLEDNSIVLTLQAN